MLTTSCIIPWDIGFVDPPIIPKLSLGYSALRSKIEDKNTFGFHQESGAKKPLDPFSSCLCFLWTKRRG